MVAQVTNITTLSGAPSSVTVTTPVVDFGTPSEVQISRLPAVGILDWRASNAPFGRDDSLPAWSNPTGEFRYWQARVTWTQLGILLERIEIIPLRVKHVFTIRSVARNIEVWHVMDRFKRGGAKGVVSIDRSLIDGYEELDEQRIVTIDR